MTWTMWTDMGKVVSTEFSEEEVRSILRDKPNDSWYAQNAAGDYIELYDGPIVVGRSRSGDNLES